MKILPYLTFTLQTSKPLPLVIERLENYVEPLKMLRWSLSRNHAPYQGKISDTGFEIHRIIHYRNSFLPYIKGRFESSPQGTLIHIKMGLHPFIIGFLCFWYLTWYSAFIPIWLTGAIPDEFAVFALGGPLIGLFVFWGAFWYEAKRSRGDLEQILVGESWQLAENLRMGSSSRKKFKIFATGLWLVGVAVFFWQMTSKDSFFSSKSRSPSPPLVSCTHQPTESPDCSFSVAHTINGHPSASVIAISLDGKTLVSGGRDKALKIWDLQTGQLQKSFQSDSGHILAVAIAPDGKTIISGSGDRMVRIWKWTTNQRPLMLSGHSRQVHSVSITPDGKTVISASYGMVKMWDIDTGELKATLPNWTQYKTQIGSVKVLGNDPNNFNVRAISPDGKTAIFDFINSKVMVWDLTTNQPKIRLKKIGGDILSAYISNDGQKAIVQYRSSWRRKETRLKVWDINTGEMLTEGILAVSQSPLAFDIPLVLSEDQIIGSSNRKIKFWNLQTAQLETTLNAEWMNSLVVSPDSKLLAGITSASYSQNSAIKVLKRP